ncbi:hypothetical protein PROFUN_14739 [Planoprotostelium fungivorum]|uniref:Uncharacterized protein n=1 Tax=Planoprotostelium fungivorum TaxID=1890364 RepID=A0A2P6MXY0_9EUKA|nr:hypothetical protein PROFUN_14739 [Planoprotostelium fungivorum]
MSYLSEKSFLCCRDVKYPIDPQRFRGTSTTFTNSQNLLKNFDPKFKLPVSCAIEARNDYRIRSQTSFPYKPCGKKFYAERAKGHEERRRVKIRILCESLPELWNFEYQGQLEQYHSARYTHSKQTVIEMPTNTRIGDLRLWSVDHPTCRPTPAGRDIGDPRDSE